MGISIMSRPDAASPLTGLRLRDFGGEFNSRVAAEFLTGRVASPLSYW